ncbi:hybrid sensor histidine kinase/response regulator [Rhodovarius lipocyclicus]|uniref:hybrid sensor histidine kinase/response regulator n=1 Tax=Rhodovarius lipocyclicus TaxID=268410 RepID=UPI001356C306|nr:hybrid sensor histidine kinase/response regulator [Rhodovarius lipocyclicus]
MNHLRDIRSALPHLQEEARFRPEAPSAQDSPPPRLRFAAVWPVLVLLPLAIYAVVLLLLIRSLQSEDLSSQVNDTAHAAAAAVRAELTGSLDLLDQLAASSALDRADFEGFRIEAARLARAKPGWQTITLSDRERDVLDLRAGVLEAPPPIADVATFERVISTGRRAVGPLRGEILTLRVPVQRDGRVRGSLAATLPLASLAPLTQHPRLPPGWLITITDAQFNIVARSPGGTQRLGAPAGAEYERLASASAFELRRMSLPGGGQALVGIVALPEIQWSVGVWVPSGIAQAPLWPLRLVLALGGVWALATALLLGAWMLRRARRVAEAEAGRLTAEAARAAENDRRKSDFLTTMSHELRTPLTGIIGFTDLLASSPLSQQQRQWVEQQRRAGTALLTLVGEVLDLSRIEEGAVELEHIPFDLPATLHDCLNLMRPVAEKKKLGLHAVMHPALPLSALGDPLRLRQIINNLLSNAIRFTRVGEVRLEAAAEPLRDGRVTLVVTVADTGIGIAPEKLHQVFDRFRQAEASTQREHGGSGLGLAICQRLVQAMGGTIRAESTPGLGSRFTFRIPLSVPPRPEPQPASTRRVAELPPEPRGLRLLVAEDVLPNQALLRAVLEGGGHKVDIVSDGQQAAELAARNHYDLGILDIRMPVMDGFTAARAIRALPAPWNTLPLIALTADITEAVQNEAMAAGFGSIMPKPFEALALLDAVAEQARAPAPASYVLHPAGKDKG